MFNFFNELALDYNLNIGELNQFNLVNISNKLIYVEGQKGIIKILSDCITFRVRKGVISVFGQNLTIKRITNTTLVISGEIKQIESGVWKIISLKYLHLIVKNV